MDEKSRESRHRAEIPTARAGINYPSPGNPSLLTFNLRRLAENLPERCRRMNIDQLEMFEAELRNQRLLPLLSENVPSLTQDLVMESTLLRWRAKRSGATVSGLEFGIELERYLLSLAYDLIALQRESSGENTGPEQIAPYRHSLRSSYGSPGVIAEKLEYLEALAEYLYKERSGAENRYQQGLNLILRVLSTKTEQEEPKLYLPLTNREFLSAVRSMEE